MGENEDKTQSAIFLRPYADCEALSCSLFSLYLNPALTTDIYAFYKA